MSSKVEKLLNGKSIFEYPFSESIESFTILSDFSVNVMNKRQFTVFKKILGDLGEHEIYILILSSYITKKIYIEGLNYKEVYDFLIGKGDHVIFGKNSNWILSCSEEWFGLLGGKRIIIDKFIYNYKEFDSDLLFFILEWKGETKGNWAYDLINRDNFVKQTPQKPSSTITPIISKEPI